MQIITNKMNLNIEKIFRNSENEQNSSPNEFLQDLLQKNFLSCYIFDILIKHQNPNGMADVLKLINPKHFEDSDVYEMLRKCNDFKELKNTLIEIKNLQNLDSSLKIDLRSIIRANYLTSLRHKGLLTKRNIDVVTAQTEKE